MSQRINVRIAARQRRGGRRRRRRTRLCEERARIASQGADIQLHFGELIHAVHVYNFISKIIIVIVIRKLLRRC